jgi:hypothetical protein
VSTHALIVTPYADSVEFSRWAASRILLRGLDDLGIDWTLHQPWNPLDVAPFDVIVCWSYGYRINNFPMWAQRFEETHAATGPAVINSARYCTVNHHGCLTRWATAGVPCASAQLFGSLADIALDYPLILRIDGQHRGLDMYLARDADEARRIVASREVQDQPPLNLAIEYIETRDNDGMHRKWRSYVVGEQIIPHTLTVASQWAANADSSVASAQFVAEKQAFWRNGDPQPELVIRAARALGSDVIALDYHRDASGRYTFFEGNRNFMMPGDPGTDVPKFLRGSGRTPASFEREKDHLGRVIARLVGDRIAGARDRCGRRV